MTRAARPTFVPARGTATAATQAVRPRDLGGRGALKTRQTDATDATSLSSDVDEELAEAAREYHARRRLHLGRHDEDEDGDDESDGSEDAHDDVADDGGSASGDDEDDDEDDGEDDEEELIMREMERIRAERAARQTTETAQRDTFESLVYGEAPTTQSGPAQRRFLNDMTRSDDHRAFLRRFIC